MIKKKEATSSRQQATSRQARNKQHADNADLKRFSQIRKKSAVICINLCYLSAYCLNQDSQDYRIYRMRNIEIENTKAGSTAAIYTRSSCHCCRDAMLRVFSGDNGKATNPVRHCGLDPQSPFIRFIRREASRLYIAGDSDLRQNDGYRYGDSDFRQNDEYSDKGLPACCLLLVACCLLRFFFRHYTLKTINQ